MARSTGSARQPSRPCGPTSTTWRWSSSVCDNHLHDPMSGEPTTLLRDAVAGDERAFDALIGPLVEPGFRVASSRLGDREEEEGDVREATSKASRTLHQIHGAA